MKSTGKYREDAYWFGEAQGRVVVSVDPTRVESFEKSMKIPFEKIGVVQGQNISVNEEDWGSVAHWLKIYEDVLTKLMNNVE